MDRRGSYLPFSQHCEHQPRETTGRLGLATWVLRRRRSPGGLYRQAIRTSACVKVELYVDSVSGFQSPRSAFWENPAPSVVLWMNRSPSGSYV